MSDGAPARPRAVAGAGFVVAGAALIQWSAAVIKPVFATVGPSAASAWRFFLGALVLLALTRPRVARWDRAQWLGALALGGSTAFMNLCFYQALARIPLGGAVAIEFLGPLLVAALGKRSWRHLLFVALAGLGVVALARPGGGLTLAGTLFAAGSGVGWASYAFASHRVGRATTGFGGLAVAMSIAAVLTLPWSMGSAHVLWGHPHLLARITIVAVMAIVLGFGAELQALRRLRPAIVSVLLALDPAVAFVVGLILLHQSITAWDLVGLTCVVVAGAGVTWDAATEVPALAL
ncbi:MAG: EamA family transporter [Acidimicrobiales bacterium]